MAIRRGIAVVFGLIGLAAVMSVLAAIGFYLVGGREPAVPSASTLVVRVSGDLTELPPESLVGQLIRGPRPPSVRAIVENIRKAKVDKRVAALLVMPAGIEVPYWGKIQEIRDAVIDFRKSGKPAIAYLEYGGDREYYLATACDKIFLMPTSPLDLSGVATYEIFLRGTLDKIGAFPDMHHIGDYKTAVNQLTEKTFTAAHREMTESLNRDAYEQLVRGIADGRGKAEADVRTALDQGPFLPEDALRAGLIDDVAYEDQIDDKVRMGGAKMRTVESRDYSGVSPSSLGLNKGPRIAVLYAVGAIVSGRSALDPVNGPVVGSDTFVEYVRAARADPSIKAIVLRVDSPGGSTVASDVIWRELMLTRDAKPDRPLIVSMSDLAASGGYYIAMPGQVIVAQPGTLTGSIGIFGGKIVTGGVFNKLGANIEAVSNGKYAEMNSPARPYNAAESAKLQERLQAFYDQFVEKVAASRHTTPERIDAVAQGRVWTGRQAKQIGLVDELGGLDRAVAVAKQRAKIPLDAEVELVNFPPKRSFYEIVTEQFTMSDDSSYLAAILPRGDRRALSVLTSPLRLFRRGEPLALMPVGFLR